MAFSKTAAASRGMINLYSCHCVRVVNPYITLASSLTLEYSQKLSSGDVAQVCNVKALYHVTANAMITKHYIKVELALLQMRHHIIHHLVMKRIKKLILIISQLSSFVSVKLQKDIIYFFKILFLQGSFFFFDNDNGAYMCLAKL